MRLCSLLLTLGALLMFAMIGRELVANEGDTDVFFEQEPNDVAPEVLNMGPGAQAGAPVGFRIKGWIDTVSDVDQFELDLNPGDVIGATITDTSGLDPVLRLREASGDLVVGGQDVPMVGMPDDSPLPNAKGPVAGGHAAVYAVIATAGTYVLEAAGESSTTGRYRLDIVVARPGIEALAVGKRQVVFVDFDGATVNMTKYASWGGSGVKSLSAMRTFLPEWGLAQADEDAVIDAVLETLEDLLSSRIRAQGSNGDYAVSNIPGQFDIEIRNSRDHADSFGIEPLVTRLVIGGTQAEGGVTVFAANSSLDPGNFSTDDDTFVMLDQLAGLTQENVNRSLNQFGIAAGWTKAELVGRALARIGAHELAHTFGCFHTESSNYVFDVMDRGSPHGFDPVGAGPDKILGTSDDIDFEFGCDAYDSRQALIGLHDTLNTIAFGLATGRQ
jgi:hypothetical protein